MKNNVVLNMLIPEELMIKIKEIAESNNISLAAQVRLILTQYCNNK